MLSIKNLKKVYKVKKGEPVVALDGITLQLPKKGMVFLLGKSGSGKSTLLNLLGGLDTYTSGEIIIKGKSSKDFKPADFDSYRNTYIGFVFQEFNILEEYTVGKNISLALELQQKKADRQKIEELMESVGLERAHFDRKTNELSGGQKQRVAIARALVKRPDIIMADEPTGNLDSQTSEQIFDALKELSKEKLVLVVSHDRENAQKYGDRIIEIADGKIINDTASNPIPKTKEDDTKFELIKSRLPIKDCFKMGASGLKLKRIRLAFTIILSVIAFTVFGLANACAFYDQYKSEIKTIRRNGENTLLISDLYDNNTTFRYPSFSTGFTFEELAKIEDITGNKTLNLFDPRHETKFSIKNFARVPTQPYYATRLTNLVEVPTPLDANLKPVASGSRLPTEGNNKEIAISDWVADSFVDLGLDKGGEEKKINSYADLLGETIKVQKVLNTGNTTPVVSMKITGVYKTDIDKEKYAKYKTDEEISIPDQYILGSRNKLIFSMGYVAPGFTYPDSQASTSISVSHHLNYEFKTASGISFPPNYPSIANSIDALDEDQVYLGGRSLSSLESDEIIMDVGLLGYKHNLNNATPQDLKDIFDNTSQQDKLIYVQQHFKEIGEFRVAGIRMDRIDTYEIYLKNDSLNLLATGSGALRLSQSQGTDELGLFSSKGESIPMNWVWKASDYDLSSLPIYWGEGVSPKEKLSDYEIILGENEFHSLLDKSPESYSELQLKNAFNDMEKTIDFGLLGSRGLDTYIIDGKTVKIVGVNFEEKFGAPLFGDGIFRLAKDARSENVSVIIKLSDNWNKNNELFYYFSNENDSTSEGVYTRIRAYSSATGTLDAAATWTDILKDIFFYTSIGISFFAGLMLMNFIGISIADKKKTIGILRAIGAKSADVFKIFFSEGIILASIIFVLSFTAVIAISVIINNILMMSVIIPTIVQALIMIALVFGIMTIATLFPMRKIANKKPIDAINNK